MIILLHTSKTMRPPVTDNTEPLSRPVLLPKAEELMSYLQSLSTIDIEKTMNVSSKLAVTTQVLIESWSTEPKCQRAAIDSFLGDIYSGLQVAQLTSEDRAYADEHMRILSGLYGILKPLDGVYPYRFEMGYKVPEDKYRNLYAYWGSAIADTLPKDQTIVDLTAVEYGKTVTKYVNNDAIVTPKFLTVSPKTGKPVFVTIHAKIARGAFAHWMITKRVDSTERLQEFHDLGYAYDVQLSTSLQPVFVCREFKGLGLSVRLT
jgi:cytoplasmic iron level regulating protein YaaA (DUF328/UPF0246 family)